MAGREIGKFSKNKSICISMHVLELRSRLVDSLLARVKRNNESPVTVFHMMPTRLVSLLKNALRHPVPCTDESQDVLIGFRGFQSNNPDVDIVRMLFFIKTDSRACIRN
jgi:hypothetical protein